MRNLLIPKKRDFHHLFKFEHKNAQGEKIWEQDWTHNQLVDQGEQAMLEVFFRGTTTLTPNTPAFWFALFNDTPVDTDTLASGLTGEVTGTGYGRISVARNSTDFPTSALNVGDWQVTSIQKTFTAGGTWSAATVLALVGVASGTAGSFYAWAPLSQTRTLANGDTLNVTMAVKLA